MSQERRILLCATLAFGLFGCASQRSSTIWPEVRPLGAELTASTVSGMEIEKVDVTTAHKLLVEPTGELTLGQALASALLKNPRLSSGSLAVRIKEAQALQAGLRPNPEIGLEIENLAGTGGLSGFDAAETTLQLSQLIELGGKRSSRVRVSQFESSLAAWDYEADRLAVFVETTLAFIDVLATQEQVHLAEESYTISSQIHESVVKRVQAGKASPVEENKSIIERANAKIIIKNTRHRLLLARKRLAFTWAGSTPVFTSVVGAMKEVDELPMFEQVKQLMSRNPAIARWATEMEHRLAVLSLERAQGVSDLTLSAGARQFEESSDTAFVLSVSMPLRLFDRNQGNILAARYAIDKARQDQKIAELKTQEAVVASYELLSAARLEAIVLRDEVLPAAQKSFDAVREGYKQGKFGYLDVLDAQRTFFNTRVRHAEVLASYHRATALLEGLIGTGMDTMMKEKQKESTVNDHENKNIHKRENNHDN